MIEFNQHRVLEENGLEDEVARVLRRVEELLPAGKSVAVFTRRERLDLPTADKDRQLQISTEISDALTGVIGKLSVRPSFIVAKGGITSSDVGVKALRVRKALVKGQIRPGIPVWQTGEESTFPGGGEHLSRTPLRDLPGQCRRGRRPAPDRRDPDRRMKTKYT